MQPWWDDEADVVIAGAGAAGLMAALTAAEAGARVIVLEKGPRVGGKAAIAIGSFTASETELQRSAGIEDSHDDHIEDMARLARGVGIELDRDRARRRIEADHATFARLVELGVAFSGPHPEAPHRRPRMHNVLPSPAALTDLLHDRARRAGATVGTDSPALDLLMDGRGGVAGIVAAGATTRRIRAAAVVLAAGDYISNPSLIRRLAPEAVIAPPIVPNNTGAAYLMALRVGARGVNLCTVPRPHIRTTAWPYLEPSPELFEAGAVLVDSQGRPCDPEQPAPGSGEVAPDETLFVVIDSRAAARCAAPGDDSGPARDGWQRTGKPFIGTAPAVAYAYLEDCRRWPWYFEAGSIAAAARFVKCGEDALAAAMGGDATAPLHVIGPAHRVLMGVGGTLATDISLSVLGKDDAPIPGLYAAGDAAMWLPYAGGHGYGISWATTSGRLTGQAAADHARQRAS